MKSVWTSDDITFCTSDCNDLKCERNSKHIHHHEIPHSYADLEGDKRFCRKAQDDEKEYQPGVWYGADAEPPNGSNFIVYVDIDPRQITLNGKDPSLQAFLKERYAFRKFDFAYTRNDRKFIFKNSIVKKYDPKNFRLLNWMIIPEPPKE